LVKLKLKMNRKRWTVVAVAVLLVAGVLIARHKGSGGTGGPMDSAASRACTDFATGYPHATTKAARLALADKVTHNSSQSGNHTIAERATQMGRSAAGSAAEWKQSANALTDACESAGWRA
jgi:hypothetical protein